MVAGTIAALKIALDIKRKKRDERKRDIRNAERDEGRVNNSLRQKKKETKRLNRRKKQIGKCYRQFAMLEDRYIVRVLTKALVK